MKKAFLALAFISAAMATGHTAAAASEQPASSPTTQLRQIAYRIDVDKDDKHISTGYALTLQGQTVRYSVKTCLGADECEKGMGTNGITVSITPTVLPDGTLATDTKFDSLVPGLEVTVTPTMVQ